MSTAGSASVQAHRQEYHSKELSSSWRGGVAEKQALAIARFGSTRKFALLATGAYGLALAVLLARHEMWADEIQAWLLARDSASVLELLANLKYEGHPPVWHLLLMPLTRMTNNPAAMQALHWVIAVSAVYVIVRHAPLTAMQRSLLPFGYYPLFEYGAVSRNYALGLLLAAAACSLFRNWRRTPLRLGAILFVMSLTSLHACVLAIGIVTGLALDWALAQREVAGPNTYWRWRPLGGLAVAVAGIALFAVLVAPAEDHGTRQHWRMTFDIALLASVAGVYVNALLPPPDIPSFWFSYKEVVVPFVEGVPFFPPILVLLIALNLRHPVALCMYLLCVGGLLAFFYAKFIGHSRHHGFLLIALLILAWARASLAPSTAPKRSLPRSVHRAAGLLLTLWLAAHAVSGIRAAAADIRLPFSNAERTARYIEDQGLEDLPMLGTHDGAVNAVVGHFRRKRAIRYAEGNRDGTFVRWDLARLTDTSDATALALAMSLADETGGPVLVIHVYRPLRISEAMRPHVRPLASFTGAISDHENFHLYLCDPKAKTAPGLSQPAAGLDHTGVSVGSGKRVIPQRNGELPAAD